MADLEKIVKIIFAGDDSGLGQTISSVESGMNKLAGSVGSATQPLADFTDAVLKIDAVLAAMAAGALVIVTNQAGKFGDSFAEISTLIDAPSEALLEFKDNILDYAKNSVASLENITGATYQIISATGNWEDSLSLLTEAEKLNVAGKGELDATTKLLVTSLNAYGKGADEAGDYSDALFTTVRVGVTNLTELSASLGTITGLASSAGVPFDDLTAAVGALTGTVGDTSLAVTQMKGVLTAIVKPSSTAAATAKELGIEFNAQALAAMGLEKFLNMVYTATDGNTAVMAKLFGRVEGLNGALVLGADTSGKYAEALEAMENRAGATATAYEKMADNFADTNQKIINNLQVTLIEIGTPLLDEWGKLADALVNIFQGVQIGFDAGAFDPLIKLVENAADAVAEEFAGIGKALPEALEGIDWSGFTEALEELVDVGKNLFVDLFGNLDLTKPDDLEKAIQKVIDTFETWVDLTKGIVAGLAPFLEKIAELAGKFSELDGNTASGIGSIAGWGKAINVVAGIIPNVTAPLTLLSGSIGLLTITQIPSMIGGLTALGPALAGLGAVLGPVTLAVGAFFAAYKFGEVVGKDIPILGEAGIAFGNLGSALFGTAGAAADAMEAQAAHTQEMARAALEIVKVKEAAGELISQDNPVVTIDSELKGFFAEIDFEEWKLQNLTDYEVKITADSKGAEEELRKVPDLWNKIILEDGTIIEIPVEVDKQSAGVSAAAAKEEIDEKLPSEKLLEIKLQGDIDIQIAEIKATAETLQTAFEWEAKIKIAGYEAAAKELEAIASSVEAAWQSTGDVISAALGVLNADLDYFQWKDVIEIIDREQSLQENIWATQKQLVLAQTELVKARAEALKSGQGIITISADGVEPELELVLQKIIKLAQIQANEEGFGLLLGI